MAATYLAAYLPEPGAPFGPCESDCEHSDCAATRGMAESPCNRCGKPIGYETGFFNETGPDHIQSLAHALCVYEERETNR